MAEYSVKKLAEMFDCSKQSIFNDMDEMLKLGYARKDGIQYFINEGGFNYLREKKGKKTVTEKKEAVVQIPSQIEDLLKQQILSLQNQLEEMKAEKEYFKGLVEKKDKQIASLQEDYKEISLKAMTIFLPKGKEEEASLETKEEAKKEDIQASQEEAKRTKKKGFRGLFAK
jgi:hypothetical protein